jgi:hypothetical protein
MDGSAKTMVGANCSDGKSHLAGLLSGEFFLWFRYSVTQRKVPEASKNSLSSLVLHLVVTRRIES